MSLFARALIVSAALALLSTAAAAKEIEGTPEALIGDWGTSLKQSEAKTPITLTRRTVHIVPPFGATSAFLAIP